MELPNIADSSVPQSKIAQDGRRHIDDSIPRECCYDSCGNDSFVNNSQSDVVVDDDWCSLLSENRVDEFDETDDGKDGYSLKNEDEFDAEWEELERALANRWDRMEKYVAIMKKQRPVYVQHVQRREMEVAQLKRNELLDYYHRSYCDTTARTPHEMKRAPTPRTNRTFLQNLQEFIVFEMSSTIPAVRFLFLHHIAMAGIFDLVSILLHSIESWWAMTSSSDSIHSSLRYTLWHCMIFSLGCVFMRCTGDLFWWLNDQDYTCVRMDYHNRVRLGYLDARLIHAVRKHLWVRCLVYLLGYYMCWLTTNELIEYCEHFWNESDRVLRHLPSKTFDMNLFQTEEDVQRGEPDIASIFLCERTCFEEIDRRQAGWEELRRAEQAYTEQTLASSSYNIYWQRWVRSKDIFYGIGEDQTVPNLYSSTGDFIFYAVVFALSVWFLWLYGFIFWYRY